MFIASWGMVTNARVVTAVPPSHVCRHTAPHVSVRRRSRLGRLKRDHSTSLFNRIAVRINAEARPNCLNSSLRRAWETSLGRLSASAVCHRVIKGRVGLQTAANVGDSKQVHQSMTSRIGSSKLICESKPVPGLSVFVGWRLIRFPEPSSAWLK